jgi:hypothetical protein
MMQVEVNKMGKSEKLKQYEILVDSATKATVWRQNTNNFFLTFNSVILGVVVYLQNFFSLTPFVLSFVGILTSLIWLKNIKSFRILNQAKFELIKKLEKELSLPIFSEEEKLLKKKGYSELTKIERYIPIIFLIAYILVLLYSTYGLVFSKG